MQKDDECRCNAKYLIAEHRRLQRLMMRAHEAIVADNRPDPEATIAEVVRVLRQVRDELEHHFNQEEADGFLANAASHTPELTGEARRIRDEHPRLLETADALIAQAMDSDQSVQQRVALELAFDELRQHLDSHELAENVLLRQRIGADLSGNENDQRTHVLDG
jgi:hemerythrin